MDEDTPIYDVALTFVSKDEEYAAQLYEALQDRLEVFYYAEYQEDLVSKDGESAFGHIFRDRARVVVVFYRESWGQTAFTQAERSAIKQRAVKEGYGFSVWVPVGEEKSVPPFLDPQFLWFDIDRWGIDGLAPIVEERVKESGRTVHPESLEDEIEKFERRIGLQEQRNEFESSEEGVAFVRNEKQKLTDIIDEKVDMFCSTSDRINAEVEHNRRTTTVTLWPYKCVFEIELCYQNSLSGAALTITLNESEKKRGYNNEWKRISTYKYEPTLDFQREPAWRHKDSFYALDEVVSMVLEDVIKRYLRAYEKRVSGR